MARTTIRDSRHEWPASALEQVSRDALAILSEEQRDRLASTARVAAYQLGAYGSFPAYASSNLSGNIKRTRDRIASLERRQAPDWYALQVKGESK